MINKKSIVIASHVFSYGTSQALRDYLLKEKWDVLFIGHNLFGNIFTWTVGVFDTFIRVVLKFRKYYLFMGSNCLNAFVGIILRKIGFVEKVIFFTPDYSQQRFKNRMLNNLYHWLDYYCLKEADLVWNSSSIMPIDLMVKEREKRGIPTKYRDKQIPVPDGTDEFRQLSLEQINRFEIGFVGHLKEGMGIELLIDAMPDIKREIPEVKLVIIGSGPIEKYLREKAKDKEYIKFTGFIGDIKCVYDRLSKCAIGIAPYEPGTISQYTDPGKVKVYLTVGLPIVITKVPQVAFEIDKEKCGIAIDFDRKQLIDAVIKLLKDDEVLKQYRENTKIMSEKYRWSNIFKRALSRVV